MLDVLSNIVGSLPYNITCLEVTAVVNWPYINKIKFNYTVALYPWHIIYKGTGLLLYFGFASNGFFGYEFFLGLTLIILSV